MDHLRTILANIQRNLGGMGVTQKLLIGSGVVIMLMSLFLVSQYAGKTRMMPLGLGADADTRQQVATYLQASHWQDGRDYEMDAGGDIRVRPEIKYQLAAEMTEGGQLTSGTQIFFHNLFEMQKFTMTKGQLEASSQIALQNELALTLMQFKAIEWAKVNLSIPPVKGLFDGMTRGTATVTVGTVGGQTLAQSTVDSVARFVGGANSRISLTEIEVIDASNGRAYKARDPEEQLAGDRLAHAKAIERALTDKIVGFYSSIKGFKFIATADVDISRKRIDEIRALPEGQGTVVIETRKSSDETKDTTKPRGNEPGPRSNTGGTIFAASGSGGQESTTEQKESEYEVIRGTTHTITNDAGGARTFLAASALIPSGYIVEQIKREMAADDPQAQVTEPTSAEIQARYDAFAQQVIENVQVHMQYVGNDGEIIAGEVKTMLLPVDYGVSDDQSMSTSSSGGIMRVLSGGGGGGMGSMGGIVDNVVLGALATLAIGMMLMMVRKAGKRVNMPTAEELVGIPPTLASDDDVVGEADESETPLTGIEVDDAEVRNRKIMDQVNELVEEDPDTAARLIKRWSSTDM